MDALNGELAGERLRGRVEYWKQIASIQIHFNDMCIRTRWLGLTGIATLLGAAAVTEKESITFSLPFHWSISLPSILLLISLIVLAALWFLDLHYYYRMLIAAVEYAENFEKQMLPDLGIEEKGISTYISQKVSRQRAWFVSRIFYFLVLVTLLIFLAGSFLPQARSSDRSVPVFLPIVTMDITDELRRRYVEYDEVPGSLLAFLEANQRR